MSQLLAIETALIERIAAKLPCKVSPFPGSPDAFGSPALADEIFVGYQRLNAAPPPRSLPHSKIIQERIAEYACLLRRKNLRSHQGTYELLDLLRATVVGFQPLPTSPAFFYQLTEGFVELSQGFWAYSSVFAIYLPSRS